MTRHELLAAIQRERAALDAAVARAGERRLTEPPLDDGWSVKDALAHITAWEQRCLGWIADNGASRPESFSQESVDAFNAGIYHANLELPLPDVLAASRRSTNDVIAAVARLADADVTAPPPWAPDVPLGRIISANSDEHYREHAEQIARWLDAGPGASP